MLHIFYVYMGGMTAAEYTKQNCHRMCTYAQYAKLNIFMCCVRKAAEYAKQNCRILCVYAVYAKQLRMRNRIVIEYVYVTHHVYLYSSIGVYV